MPQVAYSCRGTGCGQGPALRNKEEEKQEGGEGRQESGGRGGEAEEEKEEEKGGGGRRAGKEEREVRALATSALRTEITVRSWLRDLGKLLNLAFHTQKECWCLPPKDMSGKTEYTHPQCLAHTTSSENSRYYHYRDHSRIA